MRIAVFSNGRVTLAAAKQGEMGMREAFNVAFKGGIVMGFGMFVRPGCGRIRPYPATKPTRELLKVV
jgi:hypothetical protein